MRPIERFREVNPTHRWDCATNNDSIVCGGCRMVATGEEIVASNGEFRMKECTVKTLHDDMRARGLALVEAIKAKFDPETVKRIASENMPLLSAIQRQENFGGNNKRLHRGNGETVLIERRADYERVRFKLDADKARVLKRIEMGIRELGSRLEYCLNGKPQRRGFTGEIVDTDCVRSLASWEQPVDTLALHSLCPAPMLMDMDGIIAVQAYDPDGLPVPWEYEIRLGYYANTGPRA